MDFELEPLDSPQEPDDTGHVLINDTSYRGPERRRAERRSGQDRRAMVRFEPGKVLERRSGQDRRKAGCVWDDKHARF